MAADNCANCFYSKPDVNGALSCHRNPPLLQSANNPVAGLIQSWPVVAPTDWCGEGFNTTTARYYEPGAGGYLDVVTAADTGFPSTTLADIAGMTVNLVAGTTYSFDVLLHYSDVGGGNAGGIAVAMAGTVAGSILYDGWQIDGTGISGQARASALGTAVANAASRQVNADAVVRGTITVTTSGRLSVQAAQNSASATATVVKAGSRFVVREMMPQ